MSHDCSAEKATVEALQSVFDRKRRELATEMAGSTSLPQMERAQAELKEIGAQLQMAKVRLDLCRKSTSRWDK